MFINGILKGTYSEKIAYDMRTKLYKHIQDLSFSYHNSIDTGDFIQRCTSDIDTIKNFISNLVLITRNHIKVVNITD